MSEVRIVALEKKFDAMAAVRGITITAEEGKLTTLLGPSGCGKTTTLRMVAGLEMPNAGEIWIGGRPVAAPTQGIHVPPNKRNIGMVFQSYAVWPHKTAFENVAYPLKLRGVPKAEIGRRVAEVFALLRLEGLEDRYPGQLSGGQQQRVALGRAIVYQSRVLLLDEPMANLDSKVREAVRLELRELQQRLGFTTIYVTHDQVEAMVLSDKIVVMDRGRVIQEGTPLDVYNRPATKFVAEFIGQSNFLKGTVRAVEYSIATIEIQGGGMVRVGTDCAVSLGSEVTICARPEDFEIKRHSLADSTSPSTALSGRVTVKAFLGNIVVYKITCGDQEFQVQTDPSSDPMVNPNELIDLRLQENRIKLLA